MMMNSSSFESPKPYLFAHHLKNRIPAFLRYVILAQSNFIYVVLTGVLELAYKWEGGQDQKWGARNRNFKEKPLF